MQQAHPSQAFSAWEGWEPKSLYFDQKDGVSTTNRVNISRRPSSMAKVQTQVWKSLRPA
jgi:hypothetical protein